MAFCGESVLLLRCQQGVFCFDFGTKAEAWSVGCICRLAGCNGRKSLMWRVVFVVPLNAPMVMID